MAATRDAYKDIWKKVSRTTGLVKVPDLVDKITEKVSGITPDEVHNLMKKWKEEGKISIRYANDPQVEPRASEGIGTDRGLLFYVHMNDVGEQPAPKNQPKPQEPEHPQPKSKEPAKPKAKATTPKEFADQATSAALAVPKEKWRGDDKVFIGDAYDQWRKESGGTLEEFKKQLTDAYLNDQIKLGRLDILQEQDPEQIKKSEIKSQYWSAHMIQVEPASEPKPKEPTKEETESAVMNGIGDAAVMHMDDLRTALASDLPGDAFDKAIMRLAEEGKVVVYQDANPDSFTDEQKAGYVQDGKNLYTTISKAD